MKKKFIFLSLVLLMVLNEFQSIRALENSLKAPLKEQNAPSESVSITIEVKEPVVVHGPTFIPEPAPVPAVTPVPVKVNPTPTPEPRPSDCIYKLGDKGSGIKKIQSQLSAIGYNVAIDGIFGGQTSEAIKKFASKYSIVYKSYISKTIASAIDKKYKNIPKAVPKPVENPIAVENPCEKLYNYLSNHSNGSAVATSVLKYLGNYHNTCAITAGEALREIGIAIPIPTIQTSQLEGQLSLLGFKISNNISEMKPGAIAFTTPPIDGSTDRPSHVYIFMGWAKDGVANVFDNQLYDYGSFYHTRQIELHYLNDDMTKPKEATVFFMYK